MTIAVCGVVIAALVLEFIILYLVNLRDFKRTSQMLLIQTMEVLEKNETRELEMMESMKEDYKVRVNAVAYILEAKPQVETDLDELKKIAAFMSVDEIHLLDEKGVISEEQIRNTMATVSIRANRWGILSPCFRIKI